MHYRVIRNYHSFQQRVRRVRLADGRHAIAKQIRSDWSWWSFEQGNVFQRECQAYALCAQAGNRIRLLATDPAEREFLVDASAGSPFAELEHPRLDIALPSLLERLAALRALPRQAGQEAFSLAELQARYAARGQALAMNPALLDELLALLESWRGQGYAPGFLHGDLHLYNIFAKDHAACDLIDFEESLWGVPAFDGALLADSVGYWWGREAAARFQKAYEARFQEPLIPAQVWRRFEDLRDWLVNLAVRQHPERAQRRLGAGFLEDREPEQRAA